MKMAGIKSVAIIVVIVLNVNRISSQKTVSPPVNQQQQQLDPDSTNNKLSETETAVVDSQTGEDDGVVEAEDGDDSLDDDYLDVNFADIVVTPGNQQSAASAGKSSASADVADTADGAADEATKKPEDTKQDDDHFEFPTPFDYVALDMANIVKVVAFCYYIA